MTRKWLRWHQREVPDAGKYSLTSRLLEVVSKNFLCHAACLDAGVGGLEQFGLTYCQRVSFVPALGLNRTSLGSLDRSRS